MTRLEEIDYYKIKKILKYFVKEKKPSIYCITVIDNENKEKNITLCDEDFIIFINEYNKIK